MVNSMKFVTLSSVPALVAWAAPHGPEHDVPIVEAHMQNLRDKWGTDVRLQTF
jgi:hypothetical protein